MGLESTAEHLKHGKKSKLTIHITNMFSTCVKFGITPVNFNKGILISALKKNMLSPASASTKLNSK